MLNILTKGNGYVLPFITNPKLVRISLIHLGYKAHQDLALASYIQSFLSRTQKGRKYKISQVLQSPVSSPQASPKVEASERPRQAQHRSTCRKVQNGNFRVHQGLSDSRKMGVVDRPVCRHLHIPFYQSPRKYLTLSLGWIINQEKSELKPIQVFSFHGL